MRLDVKPKGVTEMSTEEFFARGLYEFWMTTQDYSYMMNFNPTIKSLLSANGKHRTHRTSASVGVVAPTVDNGT